MPSCVCAKHVNGGMRERGQPLPPRETSTGYVIIADGVAWASCFTFTPAALLSTGPTDTMEATNTSNLSVYERERRDKLQKLRDLGVDPFGGATTGIQPLATAKALYKPEMGHDGGPVVKVAGRIMLKRDMGKLSFLTLRDESGDLQVAFDKKRLDEKNWQVNDLLDLGDLIVVEGALGVTKKGEITVWATRFSVASK